MLGMMFGETHLTEITEKIGGDPMTLNDQVKATVEKQWTDFNDVPMQTPHIHTIFISQPAIVLYRKELDEFIERILTLCREDAERREEEAFEAGVDAALGANPITFDFDAAFDRYIKEGEKK